MISTNKQIKIGAAISYLAIFVNVAAMLIYTPWMKNQIGMENYGLFTLANSFIGIFLMDFGIGSSVARFVAKYRAEGDLEAANNLVGMAYKLFIWIDAAVFTVLFVLFFFLKQIYHGLTSDEVDLFKQLYIIMASFSIFSFPFTTLNGIFNAFEQFVPLKICDLLQKLLSITFIVLALLKNGNVVMMVTANAASGLIVVILKLILAHRLTPIKPNFRIKDKALLKEMLGFSIWVFVLGIAQRLTYNIAPSILGVVSNSREIARYSPASAIAGYFFTFATAINGLFLPAISRKIAQNKEDDIVSMMISVGRFQVVVLGLLYVGFATVGRDFMILWMGDEFIASYFCVLLLAFPTIFEYSQQIANTTIIAKNKVKLQAIGFLGSSFVNLAVSPILSHYYGAIGVSIGIVVSALLNFIYQNTIYYRVLKINVFAFYRRCYLPILIPIAGGIFISKMLAHIIMVPGWLGIIAEGSVSVVVFLGLTIVFHVSKDEKKQIVQMIKGKIKRGKG